jgi:hypothetical protein
MGKCIDKIFRRLEVIEVFFLKSVIGGICPWCGSCALFGRSGKEHQKCNACNVEFHQKCTICNDEESLGFNEKTSQYGCDRCGTIMDNNHNVLTVNESKRALWLTAFGLRANLWVAWLTLFTLIIGLIALIVVLVSKVRS